MTTQPLYSDSTASQVQSFVFTVGSAVTLGQVHLNEYAFKPVLAEWIVPLQVAQPSKIRESSATEAVFRFEEDSNLGLLEQARLFFEEHKPELLEKYSGRYIAILGQEVVDSDVEFACLAERVYRKHGYRAIFMPFVEETTEPILIGVK